MEAHGPQPTTLQTFDVAAYYDAVQIGAVLLSWLCCRRMVFATHPQSGCIRCR